MREEELEQTFSQKVEVLTAYLGVFRRSRLQRLGVEKTKISAIYKLPFRITRETKLSIFQFKIIHNILPCRNLLYKMNISESPLCEFCNELETLSHMLVNCPRIRDFGNSVLFRWNSQNDDNYNLMNWE